MDTAPDESLADMVSENPLVLVTVAVIVTSSALTETTALMLVVTVNVSSAESFTLIVYWNSSPMVMKRESDPLMTGGVLAAN